MKRTLFFLVGLFFFAQTLWSETKDTSFEFSTTNQDRRIEGGHLYLSNLTAPLTIVGKCSPKITAVYVLKDTDSEPDVSIAKTKGYKLKKYQDGTFVYRLFPTFKNIDLGTNKYVFVGVYDNEKFELGHLTVYYSYYFGERAKPVIYLYPEKETEVFVKVAPKEGLTVTEPVMGEGWKVRAFPDGRLFDLTGNKWWPYLFWESPDSSPPFQPESGFCVAQKDLRDFFTTKLKILGLIDTEISDFLEFWLPKMTSSPWYVIAFVEQTQLDREAPLNVVPKPESIIRVYFDQKSVSSPIAIAEQKLTEVRRHGFSVVEWGGRRYR